jgi:uncharacterized membrane protein
MSSELVMIAFPSRAALTRGLDRIMKLEYVEVRRAAIVARATSGETVVLEDHVSPHQGKIMGGTLGAAIGILGIAQLGALALPGVGPILALGAGALMGGLVGRVTGQVAASYAEFGFKREHIEELAARLKLDQPALILEVEGAGEIAERLQQEMQFFGASMIEPAMVVHSAPAVSGKKL